MVSIILGAFLLLCPIPLVCLLKVGQSSFKRSRWVMSLLAVIAIVWGYLLLGSFDQYKQYLFLHDHPKEVLDAKRALADDPRQIIRMLKKKLASSHDSKGIRLLIKLLLGQNKPKEALLWFSKLPASNDAANDILLVQIYTLLKDDPKKQGVLTAIEKQHSSNTQILWLLSQDALYWHQDERALRLLRKLAGLLPANSEALEQVQGLIDQTQARLSDMAE